MNLQFCFVETQLVAFQQSSAISRKLTPLGGIEYQRLAVVHRLRGCDYRLEYVDHTLFFLHADIEISCNSSNESTLRHQIYNNRIACIDFLSLTGDRFGLCKSSFIDERIEFFYQLGDLVFHFVLLESLIGDSLANVTVVLILSNASAVAIDIGLQPVDVAVDQSEHLFLGDGINGGFANTFT